MKGMLTGIFLLVLSVWCLVFHMVENVLLCAIVGWYLPIPALIAFAYGFFYENKK